jgi:hypothetical protein
MTYKPQWLPSPIDLPVGRHGTAQIKHRIIKAGERVPIVGMRQALTRGVTPTFGRVETPLRIHELHEDGVGMWMTDLPEELNQIQEMLATVKPRGSVLVGGLGLGLVADAVVRLPAVTAVAVVERSADVIALCAPSGHQWADVRADYRVVLADIRAHLETNGDRHDHYLLDTWGGTSESTWWEDVFPLRRVIRQRHGARPKIHCWAEDIMLGQIFRTLTRTPPHWYMSYLPCPMAEKDARWFVRNVGLPAWENRYGGAVDRYAREKLAKEAVHA